MCENNLSLQEMAKLLKGLCKAREQELKILKEAWPTPTPKQERRLKKLQQEYDDFSKKHRMLMEVANFTVIKKVQKEYN